MGFKPFDETIPMRYLREKEGTEILKAVTEDYIVRVTHRGYNNKVLLSEERYLELITKEIGEEQND